MLVVPHVGVPSLVAGASGVDPMNTAHVWEEAGLVIEAVQPSRVSVIVEGSLPADVA